MGYAAYAEVLGLRGITVDHPDQAADARDSAFTADRPVLDVRIDPKRCHRYPRTSPSMKPKGSSPLS